MSKKVLYVTSRSGAGKNAPTLVSVFGRPDQPNSVEPEHAQMMASNQQERVSKTGRSILTLFPRD